ncbi:MAG: aminopeptidase P family protein [Candidatus Marinimicrobia bacterium]|nr:aminopeptidase P family protein [Candidatus Neomarinimicrobiota bacterium]
MRILIPATTVLLTVTAMAEQPEIPDALAQVGRERIVTLLPQLLKEKELDCWLVFTREGATDPLLQQLGSDHMVARAALIFGHDPQGNYRRIAIAASYDITPLINSALYDTVISYKSEGIKPHLQQTMEELAPGKVAINRSRDVPMADGLTTGMLGYLEETLPQLKDKFMSAEELIISLFSRKSPEEIAAVRKAAEQTQQIIREAFSSKVVKPGKTTEQDIAGYLNKRAAQLNMENTCMSIVAGPMRGHAGPSDRVIQRGDLLRSDICFSYQGYTSDIQRTAYVLQKGEKRAPDFVQKLWNDAKAANRAALSVIEPGVPAYRIDAAGREMLISLGHGSFPHGSGHAIGREVHDLGPLPAPDWPERYGSVSFAKLEAGMTMAIEPALYTNEPRLGGEINVGIEEDIVVTESGYEVLGELQEELWLIK